MNNYKIEIDYSKDSLFDEMGLRRLKDSYLKAEEKSPQDRYAFVANALASNQEHAQRLYNYLSDHWLSASTPILSYGVNKTGLPISCYLSYVDDSTKGLIDVLQEIAMLSVLGGGVGIGIGIRAEDEKSVGVLPHAAVYEKISTAFRQGKTRRGSFATYLDIDHPNIVEFVNMRNPQMTGDEDFRCFEMHHAINITDKFMQIIEACMLDEDADDSWELIDPHTKEVKQVISAKKLWEDIIDLRMKTGEPMLHFIDRSNEFLPAFFKNKGLKVRQSNICTEITLVTDALRTAVCCLYSLNLVYWDLWKDNPQFYEDVCEMLDNALEIFIKNAPPEVRKAVFSAEEERSIGIGVLGFHALLQSKNIPFESALAASINHQIFSKLDFYTANANRKLALERGEAPIAKGYGVRFSHRTAVAPNASSSIIMGNTSPSIEPFRSNAYRQDTLSGSYLNKNKYLDKIILEYVETLPENSRKEIYDEIWDSIVVNGGSCRHLDFLSEWNKDVFKTFVEIDQAWVIQHAADRQPFIDQAQSLNLAFVPDEQISKIHDVHFKAWKMGLKTLYYCRSDKIYRGKSLNEKTSRVTFVKSVDETCLACE